MDPEEVHAFLEPLMDRLRSTVEMYGGTIVNTMGDGILAVFGAPVAHRDDAVLGVRSALAARDAVRAWSQRSPVTGVDFHAGVHTGWVFIAPKDDGFDVVGDTVNTASRLASVAKAGTILVGEMTRGLAAGAIKFAALDPVSVKGKAAPLEICEAVEALPDSPERFLRPGKTPFLARATELDALRAAFRSVTDDDRAQGIVVAGPAGIGKSRLVAEAARTLNATILVGRAIPYGERLPWYALASALRTMPEIATLQNVPSAGVLRAFIDELMPDVADDERRHVANAIGLVLGTVREDPERLAGRSLSLEIAAALRRFLHAAASRRAIVVVLEDLQWSDPETAAFLRHVHDNRPAGPFLIVGLTWLEAAGVLGVEPAIVVRELGESEGLEFVRALLPDASLPDSVARQLWARSNGNPLFLEEIVRLLRDRGTLRAEGGRWALFETTRPEVPENVYLVVEARIDELPHEERRLLRDASVCGQSFTRATVEVLGWSASAGDVLASLVSRGLLYSHEGDAYAFGHPVIRDVAYDGMPRMERAEKHLTIADWLARQAAEGAEPIESLAYHYGRAAAIGLFEASADVSPLATEYLTKAGDRAFAQGAMREAESWYRQALELAPQSVERARLDGHAALHLLLRHSRTLAELGRYESARSQATLAFEIARAIDDEAAQGDALLQVAELDSLFGNVDDARRLFRVAHDVFDESGNRLGMARVVQGTAETWRFSDIQRVTAMFAEAAELFGVANDAASQDAVVRNIAYLLTPKSGHEFERWQAESERLAAIGGDLRSRFSLLRTKGFRAFYLGDLEPARAWLEQSLAMARDFGDVFVEVDAAFLLARIALAEGDLGLAEELGGSLRRLGQGLGLHRTEEEGLVLHALVAARRGRSEEAADLLGRARAALEKVRAEYEMVEVAHAEAVVALEAGRWDDAIEWSEALGATTLRFDADLEQTRALLIAGRARLGAGNFAEAAEALREASARAGEREQTSLRRAADAALAEALALSGRIDEARAALDAAGDEPDRYPEALAMRLEADAIVAAHEDDRDRAQARLAAAVRSWELLGTTIWSARAAQLRSQLAP